MHTEKSAWDSHQLASQCNAITDWHSRYVVGWDLDDNVDTYNWERHYSPLGYKTPASLYLDKKIDVAA